MRTGLGIGLGIAMVGAKSGPVTFKGQALGGFTTGNKIISSAGSYVDFRPGMSLFFIYQFVATPSANQVVLASGPTASAAGWMLLMSTSDGGGFYLEANGVYLPIFPITTGNNAVAVPGIYCVAMSWRAADNHLLWSVNGGAQHDQGVLAGPAAAGGTWLSTIGTPGAGSPQGIALATDRILAMATWATEASAAQCAALTNPGTGSRFSLPAGVTASAVVDFNAARDYVPAATSITTHGTTPVTYAVSGTLALVACDEVRYATTLAMYWDGKVALAATDGSGNAITVRDSYSRLVVQSDALHASVEATSTISSIDSTGGHIGLYVNGAWVNEVALSGNDAMQVANFPLGAGSAKSVSLWEGVQFAGHNPTVNQGTFIRAIRLPKFLFDGVTSSNSSIVLPTPPAHRVVLFGDSILAGEEAIPFTSNSVTALMRGDFPTTGTGGVTSHTASGDGFYNYQGTGQLAILVAQIVAELDGTSSNALVMNFCTNDYAAVLPVATFQATYAAFLDAVHAAVPGCRIFCLSATQRIAPAAETTLGVGALSVYRTAISNAVSTRTAFAQYIECAAGAVVSNANIYTDGIHLVVAGDVQLKAAIKTPIAAVGGLGY